MTTVTLAPTAAFVGDYSAAVTATAGGVSSVRVFQMTINAAGSNQAPRVVAPPLQEVTAGTNLMFPVTASDADGDAITSPDRLRRSGRRVVHSNGSNTSATFNWTPGVGDVGEYDVLFTAANALSGTGVTHLRVGSPPTLMITPIDDVTVADGGFLSVPVHASGVPGALITLTAALPTFGTLNPPGTGTNEVTTTISLTPRPEARHLPRVGHCDLARGLGHRTVRHRRHGLERRRKPCAGSDGSGDEDHRGGFIPELRRHRHRSRR